MAAGMFCGFCDKLLLQAASGKFNGSSNTHAY